MKEGIRSAAAGALGRSDSERYYLKMALLALGVAGLTAAAAHIRIHLPFTPVPVTMQTFVVLMAGLALGSTSGSLSQVQYLALGALGLPAFAGGVGALAGPTGGYLVGFVIAAALTGAIYSASRTTAGAVLACLGGTAAIFTFGCLWLAVLTGGGFTEMLAAGVVPFIPGAVMKIAAAVTIARTPATANIIDRIVPDHPTE